MAELLKTDGTRVIVKPKNGKVFELEEIYELIGCDTITTVPGSRIPDGMLMFADDEGLNNGSPPNGMAELVSGYPYELFGNVLYMTTAESGDEE